MERALVMSAVLFGLVCFVNAQLQCNAITDSDLGSTTELSTNGLISQALSPGGETGNNPVSVQISRSRILCDASGSTRDTSSYVSILVEFQCSSPTVSGCNGTMLTRQFQFQCSSSNQYSTTVFGTDTFAVTENPTATFSTTPDNRCRACVDDQQEPRASADTHCWSCTATCTEGLRRCYITSSGEQCCNFYLEDDCVESCPSPLVADNDVDCGCGSLDLANGQVSYSQSFALGSVANHTCNVGYSLSPVGGELRTCNMTGWTGNNVTCVNTQCPDLTIANGIVEVSPDSAIRSVDSKATYTCDGDYNLSGNRERVCQTNLSWSGTDPECKKKSGGLSSGAIAGIIIGVLLAIIILIAVIVVIIVVSVKVNSKNNKV